MSNEEDIPLQIRFLSVAEIIAKNYNGREVVFYGDSPKLRELLLSSYGIKTTLVASSHVKEKENGLVPLSYLKNKAGQYYIVAPFLQPHLKNKNRLIEIGYEEYSDFVFALHKEIDSDEGFSNYTDMYGNHIDAPKGIRIIILPWVGNTTVKIDETASFTRHAKLRICGSFANVNVGSGCRFSDNLRLVVGGNSKLMFGEQSSFERDLFIHVCLGATTLIGTDCMFSSGINIYCGDGHAIFDVETGERTLDIINKNLKNCTIIGDHVWVGLNAMILGNTNIGRSSIVGAGAVVKGNFPNNCAIAGNPAKMIRKNITWSRNLLETDIQKCGEENIAMTE